MSVINTNISAIAAARNLNASQSMLSASLNRLSSGSKIVNPSDDAAGLAVSEKLGAQSQRITAALMALFTLLVLLQVLLPGPLNYDKWSGIFAAQWMKVLTFVVIVSLLYHAWVGVRDIWMDYIKPLGLRLALQVFSLVWLVGCAGWALQVLWRI